MSEKQGFIKRGISIRKVANRQIESTLGTEMDFCESCKRFYSPKLAARTVGCPYCGSK